jgi:hypothetical protein
MEAGENKRKNVLVRYQRRIYFGKKSMKILSVIKNNMQKRQIELKKYIKMMIINL